MLHQQIRHGAGYDKFWETGAQISLSRDGMEMFALDWTTEAIKFFATHPVICYAHAEALMLNRQWTKAINFKSEFLSAPATHHHIAIALMIDLVNGHEPHGVNEVDERRISASFIQIYRRLIKLQDGGAINQINESLPTLHKVLPTAHQLIEKALTMAGESSPVAMS